MKNYSRQVIQARDSDCGHLYEEKQWLRARECYQGLAQAHAHSDSQRRAGEGKESVDQNDGQRDCVPLLRLLRLEMMTSRMDLKDIVRRTDGRHMSVLCLCVFICVCVCMHTHVRCVHIMLICFKYAHAHMHTHKPRTYLSRYFESV
jgi:hypothetical protein